MMPLDTEPDLSMSLLNSAGNPKSLTDALVEVGEKNPSTVLVAKRIIVWFLIRLTKFWRTM